MALAGEGVLTRCEHQSSVGLGGLSKSSRWVSGRQCNRTNDFYRITKSAEACQKPWRRWGGGLDLERTTLSALVFDMMGVECQDKLLSRQPLFKQVLMDGQANFPNVTQALSIYVTPVRKPTWLFHRLERGSGGLAEGIGLFIFDSMQCSHTGSVFYLSLTNTYSNKYHS